MGFSVLDPYKVPEQMPEGTVVIMKPDALERNLHWALLRRVEERCGLKLASLAMVQLHQADVYFLYGHQSHQGFWDDMVEYLTSAPVIVAIFEGAGAIEKVRTEVGHYDKSVPNHVCSGGPLTIRSAHGDKAKPNHVNLIHASSGLIDYDKDRRWLIRKLRETR